MVSTRKAITTWNTVSSMERYRKLSLGLPVSIVRGKTRIPLGYKINPTNPKEFIIDEEVFNLLHTARKFLKESSVREVTAWLKRKGVKISHMGLFKLMRDRPPYTDDERNRHGLTS